ncbi:MAG: hypothetical protein ACI4FZ_07305 [Lachnospiraceae bacterium]
MQQKLEKGTKRFTILTGGVLLIFAAVLFLRKSDYVQNQLALLKSDAEYYSYVEQKNLQHLNAIIVEYYERLEENYGKSEVIHTTKRITLQAQAEALLSALLEPAGFGTEAELELYVTKKDKMAAVTGKALIGGTAYPVETLYDGKTLLYLLWPFNGEYYYITLPDTSDSCFTGQMLFDGSLTGNRLKKLLETYEVLLFDRLSEGNVIRTDKVLRSVNEHIAYQKELALSLSAAELQAAVNEVLSALLKDQTVREVYENCRKENAPSYEESVEGLRRQLFAEEGFLCSIDTVEMKLYVDKDGHLTGRDVVIQTKEDSCRIGYASVANGLSVGLEAYVNVNGVEYFFADAVCEAASGAVKGDVSLFLLLDGELKEFRLSLQDVRVIDLITGRFSGDILLTSNQWKDFDIQLSFSAVDVKQECIVSVYYGDAKQLNVKLKLEETEPENLPEVPEHSKDFIGQWPTLY